MWGEILTSREVDYCCGLIKRLQPLAWPQLLLRRLAEQSKWSKQTKPLLFELRYAGDLNASNLSPTYEYATGVGDSSVDFQIKADGVEWLVEIATLLTSDAVKRASWESGLFFGASLQSNSTDKGQSVEGETLVAQQKIGQKVFDGKGPIKFPPPSPGRYNVILIDMRGFAITGGGIWDYRQIAYGRHGLPPDMQYLTYYWTDDQGKSRPILGLFDEHNTYQRAAKVVQERIHFIGFCNDESYVQNGVRDNTLFLPNPIIFADDAAARAAYDRYPLKPKPAG